ncbi:MAG: hypothetical protein H6564_09610 [Lewinellaceae bacterium]|nr:hypothetical protein [Lewinellaceae bacterium]
MRSIANLTIACLMLAFAGTLQAQEEGSAATLYNQGLELLKAKDYEKAFPLMVKAIEAADPEADAEVVKLANRNGAIAAYYVGNGQRKADDFEGALATYDKGIEMAPGFYANYIGRAQALEGKGDIEESIKAYLAAGDISEKAKKADKAEQMYAKAENLVALAWGDKKWANTQQYAAAFLESRESAEVSFYSGYALKELGHAEKGLVMIDKAIELAPEGAETSKYYMAKAEILEQLGQNDAAIQAYQKVSDAKYTERAQYKIKELSGGK